MPDRHIPTMGAFVALFALILFPHFAQAQAASQVVLPGAPGEPSRVVSAAEASFNFPEHVEADTWFMQMMILHHAQALEMSELAPDRAERADVRLLAHRIHTSQVDEIKLMARWLDRRGEAVPQIAFELGYESRSDVPAHHDHGAHQDHGHHHDDPAGHHDIGQMEGEPEHAHDGMPGMLSPEEMEALARAEGPDFDRLFLESMIFHHEGAIIMVRELFASEAGGQDGEIFRFASHVESDQTIEIERMRALLLEGGS